MTSEHITLAIQLPNRTTFEVLDTTGPLVSHVKKAIIAEFKQLDASGYNLTADGMDLYKLEGSSRTLLEPQQTLAEAGLITRGTVKLAVEYTAGVVTGV